MAQINVLDKEVFNRIAAGEVVGSPASIVKELAENAVDAGATEVEIEIEDGGIRSVTVSDNGTGIPKSEVRKAFLPHATSKIKTAEDMETIGTLGFRGEALPSIASVSKVLLRTKFRDEDSGTLLRVCGGHEEEFGVCALDKGTIIEVSGLFYNTPARFKFLKSVRSEESAILTVVQGLILANPNVSIRYRANGELKLASDGFGFASAVNSVYPTQFSGLIPIHFEEDGYKILGFTSKSGTSKGNRSSQTIILNGRVVSDAALSASVQNAYGERLMTRSFPIFVFDIVMPFELVDVNVHPAKAEVRLRDARRLYGMVYHAVKETLEKNDRVIENSFLSFNENAENGEISGSAAVQTQTTIDKIKESNVKVADIELRDNPKAYENRVNPSVSNKLFSVSDSDYHSIKKSVSESFEEIFADFDKNEPSKIVLHNPAPISFTNTKFDSDKTLESQSEFTLMNANQSKCSVMNSHWRVVGQIFQCYLLVEYGDKGFIIDQHAAHERTIYDKLMESAKSEATESQPLLLPYIYRGSAEDCNFIMKNRTTLNEMGFDLDEFGKNSIKVSMVPSVLTGINLETFFQDLLSDLNGIRSLKTTDFLRGKLASLACKSAIKSGDALTQKQIEYFIEVYMSSGAPILCPHGRPTILPFNKLELEKRFKRKL